MNTKRKSQANADVYFERRISLRQAYFTLSGHIWKPATDIVETQDAFLLKLEIAGVPEEAVSITAERSRLIVRGQRIEKRAEGVVRYHTLELSYGKFQLVFQFPFSLAMKDIRATYENGLLSIEVPKKAPSVKGPVSIEILEIP